MKWLTFTMIIAMAFYKDFLVCTFSGNTAGMQDISHMKGHYVEMLPTGI